MNAALFKQIAENTEHDVQLCKKVERIDRLQADGKFDQVVDIALHSANDLERLYTLKYIRKPTILLHIATNDPSKWNRDVASDILKSLHWA